MKIATIVGARPQFIKAVPVSLAFKDLFNEVLIHTGQHYGRQMSGIFFEQLGLEEPEYNLGIGSGPAGWQTGKMLESIERVLAVEKPDLAVVYGDTNSTLAAALAVAKMEVPLAHIEAGLRSYDHTMPEEINRLVADHVSELLFCPTPTAVANLDKEAVRGQIFEVGDVMYDAALYFAEMAENRSTVLEDLGLAPGEYLVATLHRAGNTDNPKNLVTLVESMVESGEAIVFPVHPRTEKSLERQGLIDSLGKSSVRLIPPLGYIDFLKLEKYARKILTDSGGVQKEAYFLGVPCVTMRENTEWVETVKSGRNMVTGLDGDAIVKAIRDFEPVDGEIEDLYGGGRAAKRIASKILDYLETSS